MAWAVSLWLLAAVQAQDRHEQVFDVAGYDCRGRDLRQTGFLMVVDGAAGIVTPLHGVVGCRTVTADSGAGELRRLEITRVDVSRDLAFLSHDAPAAGQPLRAAAGPALLAGVEAVLSGRDPSRPRRNPLNVGPGPGVRLGNIVTADASAALADRRSPAPAIAVFGLAEPANPRDFGAPVVDAAGFVVGVENGVRDGARTVGWVIAYQDIEWSPPVQHETQMDRLAALSTALW